MSLRKAASHSRASASQPAQNRLGNGGDRNGTTKRKEVGRRCLRHERIVVAILRTSTTDAPTHEHSEIGVDRDRERNGGKAEDRQEGNSTTAKANSRRPRSLWSRSWRRPPHRPRPRLRHSTLIKTRVVVQNPTSGFSRKSQFQKVARNISPEASINERRRNQKAAEATRSGRWTRQGSAPAPEGLPLGFPLGLPLPFLGASANHDKTD